MAAVLHRALQLYRVGWFEPLYGSNLVIEPPLESGCARARCSWPSASGQLLSNICVELLALVVLGGLMVAPVAVLLLGAVVGTTGTVSEPVLRVGVGSAAISGSLSLLWAVHNLQRPMRSREAPLWNIGCDVSMRPLELIVFVTNVLGAITIDFGLILSVGHFATALAIAKVSLAMAPWGLSPPALESLWWRVVFSLGVAQGLAALWLGKTVLLVADAKAIREVFVRAMLPVSLTFGDSGLRCYKDHAQVTAGLAVQRDVAYGSECEQRLDVYHLGNQDVGNQIVLFLHGGGWVSGDKKCADSVPMLVELRRRGWVVVAMNHRKQVERAVLDISLALEWYRPNLLASFGSDCSCITIVHSPNTELTWWIGKRFVPESKAGRIALVGESSGAHLAALYLARIKCEGRRSGNDGRPRPDLAACVLISGAYDFRSLAAHHGGGKKAIQNNRELESAGYFGMLIREVTGSVYRRGKWRRLDRYSPIKLLLAWKRNLKASQRRSTVDRRCTCTESDADCDDDGAPLISADQRDGLAVDSTGTEGPSHSLPPCLIVHGDRDPICPPVQARQLCALWSLSAPCALAVVPFGFHGLTSVLGSVGGVAKYLGVANRGESLAGYCVTFLERRVNTNSGNCSESFDTNKELEGMCQEMGRKSRSRTRACDTVPTVDTATVIAAVDFGLLVVLISALALGLS